MSTSVLKALPGKLDIKRHSPSILYLSSCQCDRQLQASIQEEHAHKDHAPRHVISNNVAFWQV